MKGDLNMNLQVLKKKSVALILLFCVIISIGSIGVSAYYGH